MPKPEEVQKKNMFLPKPEKVPKKQKKKKKTKIFSHWLAPGLKIGKSCSFLFFLVFFQVLAVLVLVFVGTSSGFGNKIVPKPEEVPKTFININILFDTTPFQLPIPVLDFRALLKEDKLESKASSSMKRAKKHFIYRVFCSYSGHL